MRLEVLQGADAAVHQSRPLSTGAELVGQIGGDDFQSMRL